MEQHFALRFPSPIRYEMEKEVTIILIEDNPDHAELIRRCINLTKRNISLQVISNGEEAILYFEKYRTFDFELQDKPVLIFLDLRLPKVDGMEILKMLKSDTKLSTLPVIVLTSSNNENDFNKVSHYNAESYLLKPIDCMKIITIVQQFYPDNHIERV